MQRYSMARMFKVMAAAAVLFSSPSLVRADEFCDGLRKAVAGAPKDFASVRGPADSGTEENYSKPLTLPGSHGVFATSSPCEVRVWERRDYTYICYFPVSATGDKEQVVAFTARVAACLNVPEPAFNFSAPHDTDPGGSSNRGPFTFSVTGAEVQTGLTYPPDGGYGTLYLNVSRARA
jgi:hypothetical protein